MSWVDQLLPASFRGVPFQVDDISHQAGDTVVVREYPFQDLPTVFRMGEGAEEIHFAAYVIGEDYIEQRERLRSVLTGEGVLVHPTAGTMRVYVAGRYGIRENPTYEGGVARFDLTFIRAEPRRYPVAVESTEFAAEDAADAAAEAAVSDFAAGFDLADAPAWVADQVGTQLLDSLGAVWTQLAPAVAAVGFVEDWASGLIGGYQGLVSGFAGLLTAPASLAGQVAALFTLPLTLSQAQGEVFQGGYLQLFNIASQVRRADFERIVMPADGGGLAMYGMGDAAVLGTDAAARGQLRALTASADRLIETLAVAGYVRVTARMELENYDTAMAARAAVSAQCTRLLTAASAAAAPRALPLVPWHEAVVALQTAALRDMQARSRDLVRLTQYTPTAWQPVWYISYQLYGTAAYVDEIMGMNPHIEHPLLVPPGRPLRVVRRGV